MKWMIDKPMKLIVTACLVAGMISAVAGTSFSAPGDAVQAGKLSAIEAIHMVGEGDAAELVIRTTSPVTYTSYKTSAPLRLVVDLSQTTQGKVTAPIVINKGNFKTVTASRYDTDAGVLTRIDVELLKDAEAVITASPEQPGELKISFVTAPQSVAVAEATSATPETATTKPATIPETAPVPEATVKDTVPAVEAKNYQPAAQPPKTEVKTEPAASEVQKSPPAESTDKSSTAPVSQPPATTAHHTLTGISANDGAVFLAIEGGAAEFKSFRLNNPERFVVDLFDVKNALATRIIPINAHGVASARLGVYPEKLRVVLDAVNGDFPEADAEKIDSGIKIRLNIKPSTTENPKTIPVAARSEKASVSVPVVAEQPATPPVSKPETRVQTELKPDKKTVRRAGPATIESIDFQVLEGISRVSVKVTGEITSEQPTVSHGFITLTIKNSMLPKNLQRSLETHAFVSPVLRVTPLQVKSRKIFDTKIRIAMRMPAQHEFRQEGDILVVDIKHPVGLTAEKLASETPKTSAQTGRAAKATSGTASVEEDMATEIAPAGQQVVKSPVTGSGYKGRKVSLEFADAEVRKIFQLLAEVSNKNFVLGDEVGGTISLKLINVPWDQALDIILDTKGLDMREDGNIVLIRGKDKFKSQQDMDREIKKAQIQSIELQTEMFSINYSDLGSIVAQLTALKSVRGLITQDARTNQVIVKDIPQAIEDMRQIIKKLDIPEKQVMIEARIVEASSTFTQSLGVNWGVHYRDGSASFMGINSMDTSFGGLTGTTPPTSGLSGASGGAMGISFGTLTSNIQLDLRLNAAASANLVKIVASPRIATLNNKQAKISQGQQIPYLSASGQNGPTTTFKDAKLELTVTPHINANGTLNLIINAKNDAVGSGSSTAGPPINTKEATTEMLVRDGETTVIGGIFVDREADSEDGVPYLMNIPLLGHLFKSSGKDKSRAELLIFITPRILGMAQ